jgi:hypothetical protein
MPEDKKAELFSSASGHLVRSGTLKDIAAVAHVFQSADINLFC